MSSLSSLPFISPAPPPKKQKPPPPPPPTHFLAVQIDSPHIHNAVAEIQKGILERQGEHLSRALVPTSKLHLTLALLHLNGDSDEERCDDEKMGLLGEELEKEAVAAAAAAAKEKRERRRELLLGKARSTLTEIMRTHIYPLLQEETGGEPPTLRFTGLGSFQERVVFIRPHSEDKHTKLLQKISYLFIQELQKEGLTSAKPPKREADVALHGTIAKMSRFGAGARRKKKGKGKEGEGGLVRACWEAHEHWSLAEEKQTQFFEKVQLLSMRGNADGSYYEMVEEYAFVCGAGGKEGDERDSKKGAEAGKKDDDL